MSSNRDSLYLVTGGHGFIGCHLVNYLLKKECRVRVVDIEPTPSYPLLESSDVDTLVGDLRMPSFCEQAVKDADFIIHLAANMGGMGTIHDVNDWIIYQTNQLITRRLIDAASSAGVTTFLYASSACVYPDDLQTADHDVSLTEHDAGKGAPQGLYGLEKLHTEWLLQYGSEKSQHLHIRIARFHNIFGPGGAWDNGREKAPAALLRKTQALRRSDSSPKVLEIWGDGSQRRSFLFVDDAVHALWLLLNSNHSDPINIGSDCSVSIEELSRIAVHCAGLEIDTDVKLEFSPNKPVGVASRNANLEEIKRVLGWSPEISLLKGMKLTSDWISKELDKSLSGLGPQERKNRLDSLQNSKILELRSDPITIALLLPITSRGSADHEECLRNLAQFAESLVRTTSKDITSGRFKFKLYLAIDDDDDILHPPSGLNPAKDVLLAADISSDDIITQICYVPRGHVCELWRIVARRAYDDACDLYLLVGDDVVFMEADWLSAAADEFAIIAQKRLIPPGMGCVAFTDKTFPGMPTFPIIHRVHMDIFNGQVVPEIFINQDGDPYLFQLYRRWGASTMFNKGIRNIKGGESEARYAKFHAVHWTRETLDRGVRQVRRYLKTQGSQAKELLTLDIVVPSYRVDLNLLKGIIDLKPSPTCSPMFIIIVDDPNSTSYDELLRVYGHRPDIRIRKNKKNLGASASRNRGLCESAADWVHFLDDDVVPDPNLLIETENTIRGSPKAAGLVGLTRFPPATSIFLSAVHLAGVTYFWNIATQPGFESDVPWGVTANLVSRRVIQNAVVEYDLVYPKTGGGEDIDYCQQQRALSLKDGGGAFVAAPTVAVTHPWWNQGRRSYWRFYGWSKGDGALIMRYPELTYRDVPNAAELLILSLAVITGGLALSTTKKDHRTTMLGLRGGIAILFANIGHDVYRHLWRDSARTKSINSTLGNFKWTLAVIESTLVRVWSEVGRTVGILQRGELGSIGRRFDWFCGKAGAGPRQEELKNNVQRIVFTLTILGGWRYFARK